MIPAFDVSIHIIQLIEVERVTLFEHMRPYSWQLQPFEKLLFFIFRTKISFKIKRCLKKEQNGPQ